MLNNLNDLEDLLDRSKKRTTYHSSYSIDQSSNYGVDTIVDRVSTVVQRVAEYLNYASRHHGQEKFFCCGIYGFLL